MKASEDLLIEQMETGIILHVKAVPGGSRDAVAGVLGDALKIKVSAPAENGKANKATCALLAKELSVAKWDVAVVGGWTNPNKRVEVQGVDAAEVRRRLGLA